ncbi:MAG: PEP-CTERM sorting domain-containing protein [Anaerohalosphaeraceae bacterium]|nr:PEP-CTERM sorting domain-containing protein [Anaerohalosphaeraceae bacterium]
MKRILAIIVLCFVFAAVVSASDVNEIAIEQTTGSTADYDFATGELSWSAGISGYIATYGGGYATFNGVDLTANFGLVSEGVSGGLAWAKFDLVGSWTVGLYDSGYGTSPVLELSGTLDSGRFNGQYWEDERNGENGVDGKAWIDVGLDSYNATWVSDKFGATGGLSLGDSIFGLQSGALLDAAFGDYGNDDYDSTNGLTITLYGDQDTVVPEPATLVLLGLGGLLLRKKR